MFVCINEQYDDAIALLANENHEVRDPVDVDQFEMAERTSGLQLELKYALLVLLGIVLIWAGVSHLHGGKARRLPFEDSQRRLMG
ncbi:MAG TPA: hypothetical protein VGO25_05475 [Rhodanobacteraceae bacterium]|nr:hypothetical protein [Rhodanobacteraceae bacterium]